MNEIRYQAALQGQTAVARKVLEAIPLAEWWSTKQIMAELHRQGANRDLHAVEGCLRALRDAGLIRLKDGTYQRTAITTNKREEPMAMPTFTPSPPSKPDPKPAAPSPSDRLMAAATRARYLGQELLNLAAEIDDAVLAAEEQSATNDTELAELRQLKSILKRLG